MKRCLDDTVKGIGLSSECQPVVSLSDETLVGVESSTRWPQLNNPSPGDVFVRALAARRLSWLNRVCVDSAISAALAVDLPRDALLLIQNEPGGEYRGLSECASRVLRRDNIRLVYEFTERNLVERPRELLNMAAALRADGIAIALSDVGATVDSLALLNQLEPEFIKLDRALLQSRLREEQVRAIRAVHAYRDRAATVLVADGIENADHLQRALKLGATIGQGARFGRHRRQLSPPTP